MVIFPEVGSYQVEDSYFLCAWRRLVEAYGPEAARAHPFVTRLPRLNAKQTLASCIAKEKQFSLDYLCRNLVPNGYRNRMQATPAFMTVNRHILAEEMVPNPQTGRIVNGARLLSKALGSVKRKPCPAELEVLFETDCDDLGKTAKAQPGGTDAKTKLARLQKADRQEFIKRLVDQIHKAPYTSVFRGAPVQVGVRGWLNRFESYFWPTPSCGYQTTEELSDILTEAKRLAMAAEAGPWSQKQESASVRLAHLIFVWGGVRQRPETVTPVAVRSVFDAALSASVPRGRNQPPMNSGWTKVAAFACAHFEGDSNRHPQVIWDSRVATSIISRLDSLLVAANFKAVPACFADIGRIDIGRGGTRPREFTLTWPNGYRSWPAQLAASKLVTEIRDVLKANPEKYGRMPALDLRCRRRSEPWTVRGVEMVLFMDGY